MAMLKTGDLIVLVQKRDDIKIRARRHAQSIEGYKIRNPDHKEEVESLLYPDPIPNGAQALYMGSHTDSLREALKRKAGPFGYRPGTIVYHLVFWNGMAVFVSSEDVELMQVT